MNVTQCVYRLCLTTGMVGIHSVQARSRGGRWCWTLTYTGSRRDQEEGGGAGPSRIQGPGEIKRREVVLDPHVYRVQARSRGGR